MNKNKSLYEAPNTDVLVVRFEQSLMLSGGKTGDSGKAGAAWTSGVGGDYVDYEDL